MRTRILLMVQFVVLVILAYSCATARAQIVQNLSVIPGSVVKSCTVASDTEVFEKQGNDWVSIDREVCYDFDHGYAEVEEIKAEFDCIARGPFLEAQARAQPIFKSKSDHTPLTVMLQGGATWDHDCEANAPLWKAKAETGGCSQGKCRLAGLKTTNHTFDAALTVGYAGAVQPGHEMTMNIIITDEVDDKVVADIFAIHDPDDHNTPWFVVWFYQDGFNQMGEPIWRTDSSDEQLQFQVTKNAEIGSVHNKTYLCEVFVQKETWTDSSWGELEKTLITECQSGSGPATAGDWGAEICTVTITKGLGTPVQ